jgi:uncharacterized membrane protein YphA (DoxX/SURF4 family)
VRALNVVRDGRGLALARMGIGLGGLLSALEVLAVLGIVARGEALAVPMWGLPAVTLPVVRAISGLAGCAALFVLFGLFTRPAALLLSLSLAAAVLVEQQAYSNHLTLCAWSALWLVLSRSEARWSLRARIDGPRQVQLGDQILLMTQLSVVYLFTGLLKINERFLSGEIVARYAWFDLPDSLASLVAIGAVITEVGLAIGLWLPRIRWWVAVAGLGLHVAIPAVMVVPGVWVFSVLSLCLYPMFLIGPPAIRAWREPEPIAATP